MKVGMLGAGAMAKILTRMLLRAGGYTVMLSNSRGPQSLTEMAASLGKDVQVGTPKDVAAFGDIIVLCTRWHHTEAAVRAMGPVPAKLIIDTTNNKNKGEVFDTGGKTSSEVVAGWLPGSHVVKAFNHQLIELLEQWHERPDNIAKAFCICGDNKGAKATVATLVRAIGGEPIDTGRLVEGGRIQGFQGRLRGGRPKLVTPQEMRALLGDFVEHPI